VQQLGELKQLLNKQGSEKTEILAVSIDTHEDSKKLVQRLKERAPGDYDLVLLQDKGHQVIDRYGILNPDGRGWPHPATFLIDQKGIVRWKFVETDYRVRPTNEQILEELGKIQ